MILSRLRRRSVGFLENDGESWACFLVSYRERETRWCGYFSFRPRDGELGEDEVRTANIFLERSEAEIDHKARGLGKPLLTGLFKSALHAHEMQCGETVRLRKWFRSFLAENSQELSGSLARTDEDSGELDVAALQSLYASYRMDQVAHFIALVQPGDFDDSVDRILEGQSVNFGAKDRLQFAMMVVDFIEKKLPLPPFEVWAKDYLSNPDTYHLYTYTLHREGRLP